MIAMYVALVLKSPRSRKNCWVSLVYHYHFVYHWGLDGDAAGRQGR